MRSANIVEIGSLVKPFVDMCICICTNNVRACVYICKYGGPQEILLLTSPQEIIRLPKKNEENKEAVKPSLRDKEGSAQHHRGMYRHN